MEKKKEQTLANLVTHQAVAKESDYFKFQCVISFYNGI